MPVRRAAAMAKKSRQEQGGPFRLETGGVLIDRDKPVAFFLNGVSYFGFQGDTLASALLAQGAAQGPASPRYGRSRALASLSADEPSARFRVEERRGVEVARPAPMTPLRSGLKAFISSGPGDRWGAPWFGGAASTGSPPDAPQAIEAEDEIHFHTDVLIVGGGVAGIAAAKAAAASGARVLLAERAAHWGGGALIGRSVVGRGGAKAWVDQEIAALAQNDAATLRLSLDALSLCGPDGALLLERPEAPGPLRRLWRVRARRIVLASGAQERGMLFAGNDAPGVMSASAMRGYLSLYGVAAGRRAAFFVNNDSGYRAAIDLAEAGVDIAAIVDPRKVLDGPDAERAGAMGLPLRPGAVATRAVADPKSGGRIAAIEVAALRPSGRLGAPETIACDALGVAGGWCPETRLFDEAGGARIWDEAAQIARPDPEASPLQLECGAELTAAGAANGALRLGAAIEEGFCAGKRAAKAAGFKIKRAAPPKIGREEGGEDAEPSPLLLVPSLDPARDDDAVFIDPATDLTLAEVERAARSGGATVAALCAAVGVKGTLSAPAETLAAAVLADMSGAPLDSALAPPAEPRSARSPIVALGMRDARRDTPMAAWSAGHGAVLGDFGGWRAPRAYLRQSGPDGEMEDEAEAAMREARLARRGVALRDVSHLAQLKVEGPEALEAIGVLIGGGSVEIGRSVVRSVAGSGGAALGEAVLSRLSEHGYLLQAPAEIAAPARRLLAEACANRAAYWADLTEVSARLALLGPKSRVLLERLTEDDLSEAALPKLAWREARIAGRDVRVFRFARAGGLGFELSLPAAYGRALWETLLQAGEGLGLQPVGETAADILRIERGRPAPGREADGVATPQDLRASGAETGQRPAARRVLVGLASEDAELELPEGAEIHAGDGPARSGLLDFRAGLGASHRANRAAAIGRVTSSCWSPNLERAIALALVEDGSGRIGETAHLFDGEGRLMRAAIVSPVFVEPAEQNIDGWRPL